MLTARGDESDRIVGLELGADDYVVKPFSPKELVARVRAVLRRSERRALGCRGRCACSTSSSTCAGARVTVSGRPVELTATEFELLVTLMRQPGRVFTRGQLLDAVHGVSSSPTSARSTPT